MTLLRFVLCLPCDARRHRSPGHLFAAHRTAETRHPPPRGGRAWRRRCPQQSSRLSHGSRRGRPVREACKEEVAARSAGARGVGVWRQRPHRRVRRRLELLKVLRVGLVDDDGRVGGAASAQLVPVDALEELVTADPLEVEALVAAAEELGDQGSRRWRHVALLGELEGRLEVNNLLCRLFGRVRVEGRVSDDHLVQDDAERPPVALEAVARLQQHLGRHVIRSAHSRPHLRRAARSADWRAARAARRRAYRHLAHRLRDAFEGRSGGRDRGAAGSGRGGHRRRRRRRR
mmetsp:Transcript_4129/g.10718  ORF Transcript_4129/g.10718 Transcript_4129/m.10718 type:complete len:289 (+) Transcript_4129:310-1176(+)